MNTAWWLGLEQLKGEQLDVMALPPDTSFLLLGPPGSGKTNLLLLKGNHLWLSDYPNLAIVVFTKTLQRFIAGGANQYDFPPNRIVTARKWQQDLLKQYGVPLPTFDQHVRFEEQRARLDQLIREELIERRNLKGIFDALLVDESHDYTPSEVHTFRTLARVLVLSADARQKIYATPDSMNTLKQATDTTVTLHHHYRIGRKICAVADVIGTYMPEHEPMLSNCQYDESSYPSSVLPVLSTSVDAQAQAVVTHLTTQLDAYPEELLGVIAPTHAIVDQVWNVIASSPLAPVAIKQANDDHPEFTPDTRISVSTIHSAKGLEFRAVHILGAEKLQSSAQGINLSFTAVTRAKTSVHLYHTGVLPGFLEKAVREVQPPRPLPPLERLFGKKGTK